LVLLVPIEIKKDGKPLAGHTDESNTLQGDILLKSYPLLIGSSKGGLVIIGFSKAAYNQKVHQVKLLTGIGIAIVLLFLFSYLLAVFFKRQKAALFTA